MAQDGKTGEKAERAMDGLRQYRRIVLKIGSSLIVDPASGDLREPWFSTIVEDMAQLHNAGVEWVIVSSGAVGLGRHGLGYDRRPDFVQKQAAASVGQIRLVSGFFQAFGEHGIRSSQLLLSLPDKDDPVHYRNAANCLTELVSRRCIPVINENDSVVPLEFQARDNDRLAAYVAHMVNADLLILLSDVDGLFTANPNEDPDAALLTEVERITDDVRKMAGGSSSGYGTGGMITKLLAAEVATESCAAVILCNGKEPHPIRALDASGPHTRFLPRLPRQEATRIRWIMGAVREGCVLRLNDEGVRHLEKKVGLRLAHVESIEGDFEVGDGVTLKDAGGTPVGAGLIRYDSAEIRALDRYREPIRDFLSISWDDTLIPPNHLTHHEELREAGLALA